MSEFEHKQWFKSLNANGKTVYFLGNEHKVSKMAWGFQQAKIDELQRINAKNQNTLSHLEHEYQKLVADRNDLELRVDSALSVCNENRQCIGKFMIEDETLGLIDDIEKALRGGRDQHLTS